jgi:tetratricopeptide (TPR) repeat protein
MAAILSANVSDAGTVKRVSAMELLKQARELYEEGAHDEAAVKCKEILQIQPDSVTAYNILGMIASTRTGHEKDAINYFERSLELRPDQIELYNQLSFLYSKEGKTDRSLEIVDRGLRYGPDDFTSILMRSYAVDQ